MPLYKLTAITDDDDLIIHNGRNYAFSNQWGKWTEQKMKDIVAAHGAGKIRFEHLD